MNAHDEQEGCIGEGCMREEEPFVQCFGSLVCMFVGVPLSITAAALRPSPIGLPDDAGNLARAGVGIGLMIGFMCASIGVLTSLNRIGGCIQRAIRPRDAVAFHDTTTTPLVAVRVDASTAGEITPLMRDPSTQNR